MMNPSSTRNRSSQEVKQIGQWLLSWRLWKQLIWIWLAKIPKTSWATWLSKPAVFQALKKARQRSQSNRDISSTFIGLSWFSAISSSSTTFHLKETRNCMDPKKDHFAMIETAITTSTVVATSTVSPNWSPSTLWFAFIFGFLLFRWSMVCQLSRLRHQSWTHTSGTMESGPNVMLPYHSQWNWDACSTSYSLKHPLISSNTGSYSIITWKCSLQNAVTILTWPKFLVLKFWSWTTSLDMQS